MKLLLNSTPVALWYDMIHDAEASCSINLKEELESYLVFLMIRYTNRPEIANQIIASEFLNSFDLTIKKREIALRDVGDTCLVFSGLFPKLAEKRLVKISYFVHMGESAYIAISQASNDLYSKLANQFVSLMDVLQSLRANSNRHPDLLPLQAYDLWNETHSQRAFTILKQYTQAVPIQTKGRDK